MGKLQGKTVWITGASSGIGKATALLMAQEGACVALTGRRKDALQSVAHMITTAGGQALVEPGDVTWIARERRPAERPYAAAKERPDIGRHEAGEIERFLLARVERHPAYGTSVSDAPG